MSVRDIINVTVEDDPLKPDAVFVNISFHGHSSHFISKELLNYSAQAEGLLVSEISEKLSYLIEKEVRAQLIEKIREWTRSTP